MPWLGSSAECSRRCRERLSRRCGTSWIFPLGANLGQVVESFLCFSICEQFWVFPLKHGLWGMHVRHISVLK